MGVYGEVGEKGKDREREGEGGAEGEREGGVERGRKEYGGWPHLQVIYELNSLCIHTYTMYMYMYIVYVHVCYG